MDTTLRRNSRGPAVLSMQNALKALGYAVATDRVFGPATETAVKQFQRKNGLLPDGIAGPKTLQLIEKRATNSPVDPFQNATKLIQLIGDCLSKSAFLSLAAPVEKGASVPVGQLHLSESGHSFIYAIEAQRGVSNHLHWPGGESGVTLGPGYDMKERSASEIERDMIAIGLDSESAKKASGASKLMNQAAKKFANDNRKLINLSTGQEMNLLKLVVPEYERRVRSRIKVELTQYQFDAMVSFAYNPGGRLGSATKLINSGEVAKAMAKIKEAVISGKDKKGNPVVMSGLIKRRDKEVNLYLYGNYGGGNGAGGSK